MLMGFDSQSVHEQFTRMLKYMMCLVMSIIVEKKKDTSFLFSRFTSAVLKFLIDSVLSFYASSLLVNVGECESCFLYANC